MDLLKVSHLKFISVWLLILTLLAACTSNPPAAQTPSIPPSNTESQPAVIQPSPTIPLPGLVWLVIPPGGEANAEIIRAWLEQKTSASNLILEIRSTDDLNNPPENLQLVIFSTADPQSAQVSGRSPDLSMIILDDGVTSASRRINVIRPARIPQAFMAGFIATLVAPDFRSAALINRDDPLASQIEDSFKNGGRYLCGRCAPVYAPIVFFPQTATFSPSTDPQEWIDAFNALHQNRLETIYLADPALIQPTLLDQITLQNVAFLSVVPVAEEYRNQWIATLQPDWLTPLEKAWQNWENGLEGTVWETGVKITDANPDRLTEGKLELANKTLQELEQGWIYPLSVP